MDCEEARQTLLSSLAGPVAAERQLAMEDHAAICEACSRFAEVQRMLDTRLTSAVPAVSLSVGFRKSLRAKCADQAVAAWSESLPDIAHVMGCALAMAMLLLVMPQHSGMVLLAGAGFTVVTYFLQAVLRSSWESSEG